MEKILAMGIGIIALSLLACGIGLVIVEDQGEEYIVIDAPLSPVEGEYLFRMNADTGLEENLNKGIISERLKNAFKTQGFSLSENVVIKKENDYEWTVVNIEEGRLFHVKKEDGKLIISTGGYPSVQQESVSTKTLLTVPIGGIHGNFMRLNPGETGETYYTLYTRNGGPGEVSYKIYRVAAVGEKEEMAMPEGLEVSIEPSKFMAQPHKNYTSKITVKTSPELLPNEVNLSKTGGRAPTRQYVFYLQVIFEGENETIGDDWLRVFVEPRRIVSRVSGTGEEVLILISPPVVYQPYGSFENSSITLKPGETKETYYTLHTGEGGPGEVSYEIYRITGRVNALPMPEEEKLPMPEGLKVSIEPSKFFVRTHQSYTSKIRIETNPELSPGKYVLCMDISGVGGLSNRWLTVNVV